MTVSDSTNKIAYTSNGTTKNFAVPFYFIQKSDLRVYRKIGDAEKELLKQDIDYTVAGTPANQQDGVGYVNGGTVVMTNTPEKDTRIIILREVENTQLTNYEEAGTFPAELHELALDKLTMQVQQLVEEQSRAVTLDLFSAADPAALVEKVEVLYADKDNLDVLADNMSGIKTDAENIDAIKTAANNIGAVQTVSGSIEAVKTVSDAVNDVVLCAAEIAAIKDAPNQAAAAGAAASAALASQQQSAASAVAAAARAEAALASEEAAAASASTAQEYAWQAVRRNVGDVFYTSRTDAELNGAVEANGAVYNCADFSGENAVPALLAAGKLPYISMAAYAERLRADPVNCIPTQSTIKNGGWWCGNYDGVLHPNGKYPLGTYNNWQLRARILYSGFGGTSGQAIFGSNESTDFKNPLLSINAAGAVCVWMSSTGTSWNLASAVAVGLTLTKGTFYDVALGYNGNYYFAWKAPEQTEWTTTWTLANATKVYSTGNIVIGNHRYTATWNAMYWNGNGVFLPETMIIANDQVVWQGNACKKAATGCAVFGWDGAGSTTFRVPKAEKPKRVLVAKKEAVPGDESWWELYSDGWLVQGDFVVSQSVHQFTPLPRNYKNTNYVVVTVSEGGTADYLWNGVAVYPKTVNGFTFSHRFLGRYVAFGYADVPSEAEYQFDHIEVHRAMVQLATSAPDQALTVCTGVLSDIASLKEEIQPPIVENFAAQGSIALAPNKVYGLKLVGATTFVPPVCAGGGAMTASARHRQIKVLFRQDAPVSIDWGTTHFVNGEAPDVSTAGDYEAIYTEFAGAYWTVGVMKAGA